MKNQYLLPALIIALSIIISTVILTSQLIALKKEVMVLGTEIRLKTVPRVVDVKVKEPVRIRGGNITLEQSEGVKPFRVQIDNTESEAPENR